MLFEKACGILCVRRNLREIGMSCWAGIIYGISERGVSDDESERKNQ